MDCAYARLLRCEYPNGQDDSVLGYRAATRMAEAAMIPLATTTITVRGRRPQSDVDPDAEGYDPPEAAPTVLAAGVRACISKPESRRGSEGTDGADETDSYALRCDLFVGGLTRHDTVTDDKTGVVYEVRKSAVSDTTIFGLQHIKAQLRLSEGLRDVSVNS